MIKKALLIAEALYSRYSILFMFDNPTSHSVYVQDALWIYKVNKRSGEKQVILCNDWYVNQMGIYHIQSMWYLGSKREQIPKRIKRVLIENGLWPVTWLNLECPKPKFNY